MHIHHHNLHYRNYLQTLRGKLVASFTIRDFVVNMTGFFIPVYLYTFGYSLQFIAGYYVVFFTLAIFAYDAAAKFIERYGVYHTIFFSYLAYAISTALLLFARDNVWFVYVSLLPHVISASFYWPARHIDIARVFKSGKQMRHTTSVINSLNMFVAAIAPLFGGLLAAQYGPVAALLTAFIIMLFAIGLLIKEYEKEVGEPVRSTFDLKYAKPMIGNVAKNLDNCVSILIWPLFIFLNLASFSQIGLIFSISFSLGLIITYASGNWFEKFPYLRLGTWVRIVSYPMRSWLTSLRGVLASDLTGSIGAALMNSRFMARYYNQAVHSRDIDTYVFSMEKSGELGKLAIWTVLFLALLLGAPDKIAIIITFIIAALLLPLVSLVGSRREE